MVTEGQVFRNAHYTHTPTYTGPGHAVVYTGTDPSNHGIIANDWYDPALGRTVYCVEDLEVQPVGSTRDADKRSPKNILSTTWTDELEWASVGASRVYGFSLKDRGAITAAGHYGDAAFWMDDQKGFVTSTHYATELPAWIQTFNAVGLSSCRSAITAKLNFLDQFLSTIATKRESLAFAHNLVFCFFCFYSWFCRLCTRV